MPTFTEQLKNFEVKTNRKASEVVRKVALELFRVVSMATPVKTGNARFHWEVGVGRIESTKAMITFNPESGGGELAALLQEGEQKLFGFQVGETIYITNSAAYIERLEDGYSAQAPNGMVAIAVREFESIVSNVLAGSR